jgi:2-polyprenyl-6-methoxyphenol hydroxylase-like FAD-dependent oxidoreductase
VRIAGAEPVGLRAALALAQAGVGVRIVDAAK